MTDIPVKIIVDLSKPKGERESIIPLTKAEIAERDAQALIAAEEQAQRDLEEQSRIAAKASAEAKLAALGLTAEEVSAIVGG